MAMKAFCKTVENTEKSSKALKKAKVSGFDQPLVRANITADQIWLANLLCCMLCKSTFLSAFTVVMGIFFQFVHFVFLRLLMFFQNEIGLGALVAQWLALLTSDLEGPGSNPG
jgi:hypothetical protein